MYRVTGSIQNKNNKGIYHMMVRIIGPDGKIVHKSKSTGVRVGTSKRDDKAARDEANYILRQWISDIEQECEKRSSQRLMQAIDDWLQRKHGDVRANTYQSYVSFTENQIRPYFQTSNPLISEVRTRDIQEFVDHLAKSIQAPTIKKVLVVLRGVFDDAVRYDEIQYSPCDKVKLPAAKKFQAETLTQAQAIKLIAEIEQDPYMAGIMLAIFLGLRRSEIAGLRWQDVDLVGDKVYIRNTKTRFSTIVETEQTKSESSRRTLFIPLRLHNYLTMVKAEQERKQSNDVSSGHVCVWPDGSPQSPEYHYHALKRLEDKLELPSVRLHDLRHTAATLLVENGMSLEKVRDYLGHEDISVTAGIYVHPAEAAQRDVAEAMEKIMSAV